MSELVAAIAAMIMMQHGPVSDNNDDLVFAYDCRRHVDIVKPKKKKPRSRYIIAYDPKDIEFKLEGVDFEMRPPIKRNVYIKVNGEVVWKSKTKVDVCALIKKGFK